jgi:hypothetical protein
MTGGGTRPAITSERGHRRALAPPAAVAPGAATLREWQRIRGRRRARNGAS